jgi:ABC-type Mn2+/Zn2+ transport system permease subunit
VVCASLLGRRGPAQLYWAWAIAFLVSVLGAGLSYFKDWPMGATIVCLFGVTVAVVSLSVRMKYVDDKMDGSRAPLPEFVSEEETLETVQP